MFPQNGRAGTASKLRRLYLFAPSQAVARRDKCLNVFVLLGHDYRNNAIDPTDEAGDLCRLIGNRLRLSATGK